MAALSTLQGSFKFRTLREAFCYACVECRVSIPGARPAGTSQTLLRVNAAVRLALNAEIDFAPCACGIVGHCLLRTYFPSDVLMCSPAERHQPPLPGVDTNEISIKTLYYGGTRPPLSHGLTSSARPTGVRDFACWVNLAHGACGIDGSQR